MGKKKDPWAILPPESPYDELFETVTAVVKSQYPDQIYSGGADCMRVVCLPVPAFSVRFLFQQEGWPLGRFAQLVGEQETCKSSFGYEMMRWHGLMQDGGGVVFPTEPKDAPELFRSIVGYDHPRMRWHDKLKTVEQWNAAVNTWIKVFKKKMDGTKQEPGPGRKAALAFLVDSLSANLTDSEYKKMQDEGASDAHYAKAAMLMKDQIMFVTQEIDDYPFSFIGVNHLRPTKEATGPFSKTIRNITGGKALKFFESVEIEMHRVSSTAPGKDIDRIQDDERGISLEISVHKNSLAPHERIRVEMLWYTDYDDQDPAGHYRQKTYFDWYTASVEVLLNLLKGEGKRAKRLREVVEISADSDTRRVWSPTLGIPQKSRVRYREAGEALELKLAEDKDFRDNLYAEVGIRRRYLFRPGTDYREQIQEAVHMAAGTKAEEQPTQPEENSPDER